MTANFVCECGTVDSIYATQQTTAGSYLCHRCKTGDWHHQFAEEKYDPDVHVDVLNRVNTSGPSFS